MKTLKSILPSVLILCLLSSLVFLNQPSVEAAQVTVSQGQGVSFNQIDFPSYQTPVLDSDTGAIDVDVSTLRQSTGMDSGYINANVNGEWVVQNLPIPSASDYPYPGISTAFDLGVTPGTDVSTISADVVFSDNPLTSFATASRAPSSFPVGARDIAVGGLGATPVPAPPKPPSLNDVLYGDPANTDAIFQWGHPNIEAADDQCYPAAVANSLQFLEDTTDLVVPHDNKPGINIAGQGDDALVSKIAKGMERGVRSRRNGDPVGGKKGLEGKTKYLLENNLQDQVKTCHQGPLVDGDVSQTVDGKTLTSTKSGNSITIGDIMDGLKKGKNVEAGYLYAGGGGHAIDIMAAGITNGVPWIIEVSDGDQDSDSKGTTGPEGFVFHWLWDTDGDGTLNLDGTGTELKLLITQAYTPPITVMLGLDVTRIWGDPSHTCCVPNPGSYLNFTRQGSMVSIADSASYFPFTGSIQDGMFSTSSMSTVAGWPNVQSTFTGTIVDTSAFATCPSLLTSNKHLKRSARASESNNLVIQGTIKVGTNGAFPGGQSLNFDVDLTLPPGDTTTVSTDTTIETGDTLTIDQFDSLVVSSGQTLTVNGTLDNDSTDTITIEDGAVLEINGIFDNDGTVDNQGTINIKAFAFLDNDGTITNSAGATIDNDGTVTNDVAGIIDNNGTIDSAASAFMFNGGAINNDCAGVINGAITGDGAENTCLVPLSVTAIDTDLIAPPAVGANVQITILTTRSQSTFHYRWFANTVPFGTWQQLSDWTLFNDRQTWSATAANRYVVLAHVAESDDTVNFHQGGFVFETQGNSANPIQITDVTTDIVYPQAVGTPITLSATATGGSGGTLYLKYFYRLRMGTWTAVGPWTEDGNDTWTPQEEGVYTLVVHVSEDNTIDSNPSNQAGMTVTIGE